MTRHNSVNQIQAQPSDEFNGWWHDLKSGKATP